MKIIDFGLAWIKGERKDRVQGTPEYMAPEQAKGGIVNEQTDIYNFGATMYRLTTWRLPPPVIPAAGGLPMDAKAFTNVLKPVQELNPQAPKKLCDLIHQCLSYKAAQRPERVGDILPILHDLVEEMVQKPEDSLENLEW
ncbi:MAG: protein kinase [Gemmataceae bacterium]|nr:protein kinase [Gemmataceae bacterium]